MNEQTDIPVSYGNSEVYSLDLTGKSDSEQSGEQYKGRTSLRRLSDGVRRLSASIDPKGQRFVQVNLEVDLNHISLLSVARAVPFAHKRGWLWKCKCKGDRWLKRYFVLQGQLVLYFAKETDKSPKGAFCLHSYAQIDHQTDKINGRIHCFDVDTPERTYYLSAEGAVEALEWGEAFSNACGEAHRTLHTDVEAHQHKSNQEIQRLKQELSKKTKQSQYDEERRKSESEAIQMARSSVSVAKVETASIREDLGKAKDQLLQWQKVSSTLLQMLQKQDQLLTQDQRKELQAMSVTYKQLSDMGRLFFN